MIRELELRDRRALAIGVAVVGGLALMLRGGPAWWHWRADIRATAVEAISRWRETQEVIDGLPRELDSLGARTQRLRELGPVFLSGASPAEAGSALAALIGDIARGSQVRLDATNIRVDTTNAARPPRIVVEVQATADVAGLADLVRRLEYGPTLLAIRRLSVRAANPHGDAGEVENLALRLSVEGIGLLWQEGNSR